MAYGLIYLWVNWKAHKRWGIYYLNSSKAFDTADHDISLTVYVDGLTLGLDVTLET